LADPRAPLSYRDLMLNRCLQPDQARVGTRIAIDRFGKALLFNLSVSCAAVAAYVPSALMPPEPLREFRGVWVASVKNIDWPSQPGLSTAQQKSELIALLDRAAELRLNAIFLQIRPSCDALYPSAFEPWSEYLTGRMGQVPSPFYDPLAFAIEEAHRRGLELHAWFNPFRARHVSGISPIAPNHISKTRPALVKVYGKSLWLDPGEPLVIEHVVRVVQDVVQRYEIDGVHFDDYFYPYEEKGAKGQPLPFPDWSSWKRYRESGGKLSKEEWRRQNVNNFVLRMGGVIKAQKPWVKFGISPFGIWRPGFPPQIRGFDAYERLYADARKWFSEGTLDYLAPQLYWASSQREQSYPVLLKWWAEQNPQKRHLWPGNSLNLEAAEIANQIRLTRKQPGATGNILWSARPLMQNRHDVATLLMKEAYNEIALVPPCPWIDQKILNPPHVAVEERNEITVRWSAGDSAKPAWWLWQVAHGGKWSTELLPGRAGSKMFGAVRKPEAVALRAIGHAGQASAPVVLEWNTATSGSRP
jgi:uncharacterized lipoprotein YddW (UPF0748 family)